MAGRALAAPKASVLRTTVPAGVDAALAKALAPTPADRFATVKQFAAALHPQGEVSATRPPQPHRTPLRHGWFAAATATVIVGAGVTALLLRFSNHAVPTQNSVAVLYFDNLSPDTADAYLADGLTDEIIDRLGSIERLQVKSRTAVARFRGSSLDPGQLGRALAVAYLVNGTVRRSSAHLRVTVELVRASNGDRLWGQLYDRNSEDLLTIEADIAVAVTKALRGKMLPAERSRVVPIAFSMPRQQSIRDFRQHHRHLYGPGNLRHPRGTVNWGDGTTSAATITDFIMGLALDNLSLEKGIKVALKCPQCGSTKFKPSTPMLGLEAPLTCAQCGTSTETKRLVYSTSRTLGCGCLSWFGVRSQHLILGACEGALVWRSAGVHLHLRHRSAPCGRTPAGWALRHKRTPSPRLKLSGRGGGLVGKGSPLIAAAPGRSLSATR